LDLVAVSLDAAAPRTAPGGETFADVRVIEAAGRQVPYLVERASEPLSLDLVVRAALDSSESDAVESGGAERLSRDVALRSIALAAARADDVGTSVQAERRGRRRARADRSRREPWIEPSLQRLGSMWTRRHRPPALVLPLQLFLRQDSGS